MNNALVERARALADAGAPLAPVTRLGLDETWAPHVTREDSGGNRISMTQELDSFCAVLAWSRWRFVRLRACAGGGTCAHPRHVLIGHVVSSG